MSRHLLLAGAVVVFTASGALAADITESAAYDWTGPYIGLQAGYGWSTSDVNISDFRNSELSGYRTGGDLKLEGFIGGAHAGFLYQADSLVFGLEGDIELADLDDRTDFRAPNDDLADFEKSMDWSGSLRLRAGIALDRVLLYTTGGLAFGDTEFDFDFNRPVAFITDGDDGVQWGWTIGGGVEYALTDSLSARIEYRYTDLGDLKLRVDNPPGNDFNKVHVDNDFHAVRAGLSWHF